MWYVTRRPCRGSNGHCCGATLLLMLAAPFLLVTRPVHPAVEARHAVVRWRRGRGCRDGSGAAVSGVAAAPRPLLRRPRQQRQLPLHRHRQRAVEGRGARGGRGRARGAAGPSVLAAPRTLLHAPLVHHGRILRGAVVGRGGRGRERPGGGAAAAGVVAAPGPLGKRPPPFQAVVAGGVTGRTVIGQRRGRSACGDRGGRLRARLCNGGAAALLVLAAPVRLLVRPETAKIPAIIWQCSRGRHRTRLRRSRGRHRRGGHGRGGYSCCNRGR
mmetsp:Transcript_106769/g.312100  ORF Transcript_106769/g.312100 Transcript_106769/m.312100 type:complete len:271 (-) Transcript_106769:423-1235(-)